MSTYLGVNARLAKCLNSVINVKALVGAFNQEKALIGAFSVIVRTDGSFAALVPSHESDWARKHFLKCVETGRWS